MEKIVDEKSKYSSIQLRQSIKEDLLKYCTENGYKLSGLVEKLIQAHLSGSLSI
jgi:hypothetical protein